MKTDKINDTYYAGFEGEPEIRVIYTNSEELCIEDMEWIL